MLLGQLVRQLAPAAGNGHSLSGNALESRGSLHCRESDVGNAQGRCGLCETVLLMGSEESEFTQTTV